MGYIIFSASLVFKRKTEICYLLRKHARLGLLLSIFFKHAFSITFHQLCSFKFQNKNIKYISRFFFHQKRSIICLTFGILKWIIFDGNSLKSFLWTKSLQSLVSQIQNWFILCILKSWRFLFLQIFFFHLLLLYV